MTILDLIKKSAIMLNIKQVLEDESLNSVTSENEVNVLSNNFELKRLFEFSKLVLNEVISYSPNIKRKEFKVENGAISIDEIDNVLKIIGVKNDSGYVKFSIVDNQIKLKDGVYTIIYNQSPIVDSILSNIDINGDVSEDLLVAGVNSYYCLATGLYAEYNVYNSQFVDRLSRIKNLKLFAMPCRSWND